RSCDAARTGEVGRRGAAPAPNRTLGKHQSGGTSRRTRITGTKRQARGLHSEACTRRLALGGLHSEACTRRLTLGGPWSRSADPLARATSAVRRLPAARGPEAR